MIREMMVTKIRITKFELEFIEFTVKHHPSLNKQYLHEAKNTIHRFYLKKSKLFFLIF